MTDLLVRPARPEDREPVLAFCQRTWDWGDYIPRVWDDWLSSTEGRLLVGELAGRPVAVSRAVLLAPGEGWLEGMRVDPDRRGAGVGRAMSAACLQAARELGARVVRLATLATNYPIHRIAAELGYRRAAVYHVWGASSLPEDGPLPVALGPECLLNLAARLATSPTRTATGGLVWRGRTCRELTPAALGQRLEAGEALTLAGQDAPALTIAAEPAADGPLELDYVDTLGEDPAPLAELALALRREAARRGRESIEARVPDSGPIREAMARAGFGPGEPELSLWIFEWVERRSHQTPSGPIDVERN